MATRLYLPSSGEAPISPLFDAGWGVVASADRVRGRRLKTGTAMMSRLAAESVAIVTDVLVRQYVFAPMAAQRIGGAVKAMVRCMESATTADMRAQMAIRVVSGDGLIARGTLLGRTTTGLVSEWGTALAARKFPPGFTGAGVAVTPVTCQEGDRLVVEVGCRAHNTTTSSRAGTVQFGDPTTAGDLAEAETAQSALCPWVEFSQNLLWRFPVAVHERPGYSVSIVPDDHTGMASVVVVSGTPPSGAVLHIEDAHGTEEIAVTGAGSWPRSRASTVYGSRLN